MDDFENISDAYFRLAERAGEREHWAWDWVENLIDKQPDEAWLFVLQMVEKAPTKTILSYLGAGPIENLVKYQNKMRDLCDEVERGNAKLTFAALSVWLPRGSALEKQLTELLTDCNAYEVDPLPDFPVDWH